jgi:hypothetical protein
MEYKTLTIDGVNQIKENTLRSLEMRHVEIMAQPPQAMAAQQLVELEKQIVQLQGELSEWLKR